MVEVRDRADQTTPCAWFVAKSRLPAPEVGQDWSLAHGVLRRAMTVRPRSSNLGSRCLKWQVLEGGDSTG